MVRAFLRNLQAILKTFTQMTDTSKQRWYESLWSFIVKVWADSLWGVILKAAIYGTLLNLLVLLFGIDSDKILSLMYYVLIGLIAAYVDTLKKFKEKIQNDNDTSNVRMLKIATDDIEEKILRKLVFTNAVILDR